MFLVISKERAAKAAYIHGSRCFLEGQINSYDAYYESTHFGADSLLVTHLQSKGRKYDLLGALFYNKARQLEGKVSFEQAIAQGLPL